MGKRKSEKLHLVSWEKIKKPYSEGGLQIRSIQAQNLAMGTKLLWQLISGISSWSRKVLWKKYFPGQRLRCLDNNHPHNKGTPIYKLCIKVLDHFRSLLYWIPGNGKKSMSGKNRSWETSLWGKILKCRI